MEVTEKGIVTDVKFLPLNALSAMEVTEDGIYKSLLITAPDESFRVVIKVADAGNALALVPRNRAWERVTSVRPLLPAKAKSPREVTPVGMETDVRLLSRNAEAPMEVSKELEGMVRELRPIFR